MKHPALFLVFAFFAQWAAGASYDNKHFLLDQSLNEQEVAASPYLFNKVAEALSALNNAGKLTPNDTITLDIAPGVYWIDDPDDPAIRQATEGYDIPYGFVIDCPIVRLNGLSDNPNDVVLAGNRGQMQGAMGNFTMFRFNSTSIEVSNITFGNFCSVDLNYDRNKSLSRPRRSNAITQAQIAITNADRMFAWNCRFIGRLNLCPFVGARRSLFTDCHFECTDDALAGSAIYSNCHFEFFSSKPFYSTPSYGAVFLDCKIDTHVTDTQYFIKDSGGVILLRTDIRQTNGQKISIKPCYGKTNASSYYSQVTLNGAPVTISDATDITDRTLLNALNIPNLLAGDDKWDPLDLRATTEADCLDLPVCIKITGAGTFEPQNDSRQLNIEFCHWGGYEADMANARRISGTASWNATSVIKISNPRGFSANATSQNVMSTKAEATIRVSLPSGLAATCRCEVLPKLDEAPTFTEQPTLTYDKKERGITVSYKLSAGKEDRTRIVWYRYTNDDLSDTIAVRQGTTQSENVYVIGKADRDKHILAKVTPCYANTRMGEPALAKYTEPITVRSMPNIIFDEQSLNTDFHNLPVGYQPVIGQGIWTFDTNKPADTDAYNWTADKSKSWFYGMGVDGCGTQMGLLQASRGARCIYLPARDKAGNMEAIVKINPAKTAGQGFGSATGQYLDICIKYDPSTQSGYALRIERVPDYDNACSFRLMEYKEGIAKPISDAQPAICYRSTCTVTVSLKGTTLTATAITSGLMPAPSSPELQTEVSLKATVAKTDATGFCMQHTGSVGSSASMIKHVSLKW